MLKEIHQQNKLSKNKLVVGVLSNEVIEFLKDKGIVVNTMKIYLTSKGLSHLARDSKKNRGAGLSDEDIFSIPEILNHPTYIYFDSKKDKLNLLYCKDVN